MNNVIEVNSQMFLIGIIAANSILIVFLFIMNFLGRKKIKKMREGFEAMMAGLSEDINIEKVLTDCINKINRLENINIELEKRIMQIDDKLLTAITKVGVVRFNAFENVGSELSYSVALLDGLDNGFVISGIYTKASTASYVKAIIKGKPQHILSEEEKSAIKNAGATILAD